jgi:excinuclease ABC subunit A
VVDLGPEGGDGGGRIIAAGTPEQVASVADSPTGEYLQKILPAPVMRTAMDTPKVAAKAPPKSATKTGKHGAT